MKRPAGTVLRIAAPQFVNNLPEHNRQPATAFLNKVGQVAVGFNDAITTVFADTRLTPQGQYEQAARNTDASLASLAKLEAEAVKLSDRAAGVEKALLAKASAAIPKNIPPDVLREIRDELRQLAPAERLNIYRTTTDPMVIAAIEAAPQALGDSRADGSRRMQPFVDAAELSAARLERAVTADTATATTMYELRELAEVYRLAVNSVRREIMDAASAAV
jgi:hypothetical protein